MNKKKSIVLGVILIVIISNFSFAANITPLVEDHDFGTYIVSSEYIKVENNDNEKVYVYCADGDQNKYRPNNIMVKYGTNKYSLAELEDFEEGIMGSIYVETMLKGIKPARVDGDDSYTLNGYPLVIVKITMPDGTYQIQNYIVRDYSYVYVALWCSDLTKSTELETVGSGIINTFQFK